MRAELFPPIPIDTAKAARSVFGRSNFYLATGDRANSLFSGLILEDLIGGIRRPAGRLARLYLITIFQFMETLPDHLAAEALRLRVDWKYALHLPLKDPGLDAMSFCEFRSGLLKDSSSEQIIQTLLSRLSEVVKLAGKQRLCLESDQVVASVCRIDRLARIWESFNQAVEALATKRPELLREISLPHWYGRYNHQRKNIYLESEENEQIALAVSIGADGDYILKAIADSGEPILATLPQVLTMKQVWKDQFERSGAKLSWRKNACAICFSSIDEKGSLG